MTTLVRWNPARDAFAFSRAVDRFFNAPVVRPARVRPANFGPRAFAVDVYEADDNLIVEAALPGIAPDQVDISIEDNKLTIEGKVDYDIEDSSEDGENEGNEQVAPRYYHRERFAGSFKRAFALPIDVDAEAAEAKFENGLLTVALPKAETAKRHQISVKTA